MAGIRMSRWIGVVAVVGFGALLGACGPSKSEQAMMDENKELRSKVGDLDSRLVAAEGNVSTLSTKVGTLESRPVPMSNPGLDGMAGGGGRPEQPVRSEGRRISLTGNLFPSGSDQLTAEGKKQIDAAVRGVNKGSSLSIEGYSDATPIKKSKWASNEALSAARAQSVSKYLSGKGYSISGTEGFGAVSRNGKPASRRVEIVVN